MAQTEEPLLTPSYNLALVLASVAISLMAAFTGLSMTRGLSQLRSGERQLRIAMGAIALGGGIWSMHFIAMLAIRLPIPVIYDVLPTVASALIAILLSGIALLIMHYTRRTPAHFILAGAVLGVGITVMHYIGMAAMQLCSPVYAPVSILLAGGASLVMGVAAIWVAYGARTRRNILLGTLVLGSTVVVVHFVAMAGTGFLPMADSALAQPMLAPQQVALVVLVSGFVICGAFLLTGATFLTGPAAAPAPVQAERAEPPPDTHSVAPLSLQRIPIERRGHTEFVDSGQIAALRAEGHYTIAYCCEDKFFCPWSISEAEKRLRSSPFVRAHRSYLVNVAQVSGFERHRDGGFCFFTDNKVIDRIPVSRNRVAAMREALGL